MSKYSQNPTFQRTTNHNSRPYTWTQYDNENSIDHHYPQTSKYKQNHNNSPFTNKRHIRQQSSGLDSIQNLMQSRQSNRGRGAYDKKQYASYQSQQIAFLKEKLLETHGKLLKQLQVNNVLDQQKEKLQKQIKNYQRINKQLQYKIKGLQSELDQTNRLLSHRVQKNQQKYRSIQNKLQDQNKKNVQLKQDIQIMRNKILEATMEKNMLQDANAQFKQNLKKTEKNCTQLQLHLRQRDQHIQLLEKQISNINNKCAQMDNAIGDKINQIQQYQRSLNQKRAVQKQLQHLIKMEQDRNSHLTQQISELQRQNNHLQQKLMQSEKQLQKQKQQIYWLQNNSEKTNRNLHQEIDKLNEQLENMNIMYKEIENELNYLRKKPMQQAQKKRRHYQITKQLVHQLQNQQQFYGNSGSRGNSQVNNMSRPPPSNQISSLRGSIGDKKISPSKVTMNKTLTQNQSNYGYFKNKSPASNATKTNSYANLMKNSNGYQQQKNKYISNLSDVGQLEGTLFNCNLQRKKLKAQIQRLDENKVKTRQMIVKRKKLEQQLEYQDKKIQKLRQELRRLRVS